MGQITKKKKFKYITLCILLLFSVLISPIYSNAAYNVSVYGRGIFPSRTGNGTAYQSQFWEDDTSYYSAYWLDENSVLTTYYVLQGLPEGSFNLDIEYTIEVTSGATNQVYPIEVQPWIDGKPYHTSYDYKGWTLPHRTSFYYNFGLADSSYIFPSQFTTSHARFHVGNFYGGTGAIGLCFFVPCNDYTTGINEVLFEFKIQSITVTPIEEIITDSLDNITNPDSADKDFTDDFQNESSEQAGEIDNLVNDMNSMDKVDVNNAGNITNDSVNFDAIDKYSNVLSAITSSNIVVTYMITLFGVALCAYVLFGKRR